MEVLKDWLGLVALVISVGGTAYAWLTSGSKTNAKDLSDFKKEVEDKLGNHGSRIQSIESEMKHMPDKDMVHELQITMKDIHVEMANIKAGTEAAVRASRRVEDFLYKKAGEAA